MDTTKHIFSSSPSFVDVGSMMDPRLLILGFWLLGTFLLIAFGSTTGNWSHCQQAVKAWADEQIHEYHGEAHEYTLKELLFFLHVPRTGGRTYYQCFLRNMFTKEQRCPRSYDKLRFDPSHPECRLLTTHNDYSILTRLPREKTSVVTTLRHPMDRVLSTYEFSIEVAARFLKVRRDLAKGKAGVSRSVLSTSSVSTLDIWPWRLLVPWMRDDLFRRRDARIAGLLESPKGTMNPYNVSSVAMPLHEFIYHPDTFELVHNGATFQIAGLTNNSFTRQAKKIRSCVLQYPDLGFHVLHVAKMRLGKMLYVGLTEKHGKSAAAFATIVGGQVFSQWVAGNHSLSPFSESSQRQASEGSAGYRNLSMSSTSPFVNSVKRPQESVQELLETYHSCVKPLRANQASRKIISLKNITPVNFSSQSRKNIPNFIAMEILRLNSLDVELYKHAETLFDKQEALLIEPSRFLAMRDRSVVGFQLSRQQLESNNRSKDVGFMIVLGMGLIGVLILAFLYLHIQTHWTGLRLYSQKLCRSREKVRMKR